MITKGHCIKTYTVHCDGICLTFTLSEVQVACERVTCMKLDDIGLIGRLFFDSGCHTSKSTHGHGDRFDDPCCVG